MFFHPQSLSLSRFFVRLKGGRKGRVLSRRINERGSERGNGALKFRLLFKRTSVRESVLSHFVTDDDVCERAGELQVIREEERGIERRTTRHHTCDVVKREEGAAFGCLCVCNFTRGKQTCSLILKILCVK